MSGSTYAVVYTSTMPGTTATAASGAASGLAVAGGAIIAGAALYMAARKMHGDYTAAMTEYQDRCLREAVLTAEQNAAFALSLERAKILSRALNEKAIEDPNTAFLLGGLGRLKERAGGISGPDGTGPSAGAALVARCEELLDKVADGEASANYGAYETLSEDVSKFLAEYRVKTTGQAKKTALAAQMFTEETAALREDLELSPLTASRHKQLMQALLARLDEVEGLAPNQPSVALQSLRVLRERFRGEVKGLAQKAEEASKNAMRVRQLVGEISAKAQAVLQQEYVVENHAEAEKLLKRVSSLVAASPVELSALELLADEAAALFERTQQGLDEQAMQEHLEDQVAQVLGTLGYRVAHATNGQEESKMVAVLDSGLGVQLNIDGKGNLSGEMVAFSEDTATVNAFSEEKVCDLMDAIFDGLRRKSHIVKEKKRKHFKAGQHRVEVLQLEEKAAQHAAIQEKKAMHLPAGQ